MKKALRFINHYYSGIVGHCNNIQHRHNLGNTATAVRQRNAQVVILILRIIVTNVDFKIFPLVHICNLLSLVLFDDYLANVRKHKFY